MKTVEFASFVEQASARKTKLAADGKLRPDADLVNQGLNRTPAKRALLKRINARIAAGKKSA